MSDAKPVVAPEDHPAGSGRTHASNRPQISIAVALLLVLVSAVFLAGLFYASRVPSVQTDIAIWMGVKIPESEAGNLSQVLFIMFTFTSPLAIAMILSLVMSVWNKFAQK
ncbi:hypothetical protein LOC71_08965 [Rhodopirellula sp. JC740]|uniref:Uncharacterized protein n=1 Tax=Rhodopirellula halodulae TaxID=2894198 RepID=A0ABS8NFT1_9BACT|nr:MULTISPECIES: hypothetical protein [unclassified Rhodopirellula]MCC9642402.1 hypothetical protein [Rhodopirellula sp. JC740]MCC9654475.1 hypothetical protein [Rhodopirellula sp. JC737]